MKRKSTNPNYIKHMDEIALSKVNFTTNIAKMVFNEAFLHYKDNICNLFNETKIMYSLHGDGTYQIVLSTNTTKCCLYILYDLFPNL